MSPENCHIKCDNFQQNIGVSYQEMRNDTEFFDVTLVCEGNKQILVHKVVLASSSVVLSDLLKSNKHSSPLIYLRGIKVATLSSLIDFIYRREAKIHQEDYI